MKKIASLILALALSVTVFGMGALAADKDDATYTFEDKDKFGSLIREGGDAGFKELYYPNSGDKLFWLVLKDKAEGSSITVTDKKAYKGTNSLVVTGDSTKGIATSSYLHIVRPKDGVPEGATIKWYMTVAADVKFTPLLFIDGGSAGWNTASSSDSGWDTTKGTEWQPMSYSLSTGKDYATLGLQLNFDAEEMPKGEFLWVDSITIVLKNGNPVASVDYKENSGTTEEKKDDTKKEETKKDDTKKTQTAGTFDMGIAAYIALAGVSATGLAFMKKKR